MLLIYALAKFLQEANALMPPDITVANIIFLSAGVGLSFAGLPTMGGGRGAMASQFSRPERYIIYQLLKFGPVSSLVGAPVF